MKGTSTSIGSRGRVICAALLAALPVVGWCGPKEDLIQLEHQRNEALIAGDWAAYDALLGEEFFHAHVLGGVLQKEPHVAHLKAGNSKVKKVVLEDLDVRLYGDVAVVSAVSHVDIAHVDLAEVARLTGVSVEEIKKGGVEFTRHSRYLHVWAKKGAQWKLVARQATYLPEDQ
jgi:ketosteroid isomerase-like protein